MDAWQIWLQTRSLKSKLQSEHIKTKILCTSVQTVLVANKKSIYLFLRAGYLFAKLGNSKNNHSI